MAAIQFVGASRMQGEDSGFITGLGLAFFVVAVAVAAGAVARVGRAVPVIAGILLFGVGLLLFVTFDPRFARGFPWTDALPGPRGGVGGGLLSGLGLGFLFGAAVCAYGLLLDAKVRRR